MPLNRTNIEDALFAWVVAATGLPEGRVIHANQNSPQPQEPYAVIDADTATRRVGLFDEENLTDDPGVIERTARRRITVSVNVYGEGAMGLAEQAADGLERYSVREALAAADLVPLRPGDIRDLTFLEETKHQPRAQFDAFFSTGYAETEDVGWVEHLEVTGETTPDGVEDPLVYTATFEL